MTDYQPKHRPGQGIPMVATGAITGGLVTNLDGTVSGANSTTWLGVASQDAAIGQTYTAWCEGVQRPQAAGALAAGVLVKCAAAGQVTTWVSGVDAVERLVGITLEAASGAGVQVATKFVR